MYSINTFLQGNNFKAFFSQETLNFSYPNTDYNLIALTKLSHFIFELKSKKENLLNKVLKNSKNILFLNAHGKVENNQWSFYSYNKKFNILNFLKENINGMDTAIIYVCNNNYKLPKQKIPILYSLTKARNQIKLEDNFIIT